jgi:hypothetical protein
MNGEAALPVTLVTRLVEEFRDRAPRRRALMSSREDEPRLTSREWEVLELMRRKLTTAQIARTLVVSPATVRSHVAAILRARGGPRGRREIDGSARLEPCRRICTVTSSPGRWRAGRRHREHRRPVGALGYIRACARRRSARLLGRGRGGGRDGARCSSGVCTCRCGATAPARVRRLAAERGALPPPPAPALDRAARRRRGVHAHTARLVVDGRAAAAAGRAPAPEALLRRGV